MHRQLSFTLLIALCGVFSAQSVVQADEPLYLLFFGNSYTQAGGTQVIPDKISYLAVADGYTAPVIVADLAAAQGLEYHIGEIETNPQNNVTSSVLPEGETWDYVIMQGHSLEATSASDGDYLGTDADFRSRAQTLYTSIRDHESGNGVGVTAVLYETWARGYDHDIYPSEYKSPYEMQDEITTQYRLASDEINAAGGSSRVATVGEAFELMDFDDSLYGSDDAHLRTKGYLLSALVLYRTIYNEDVSDISYDQAESWAGVDEETWYQLVAIADAAPIQAPEPASLGLLGLGGLALLKRRR